MLKKPVISRWHRFTVISILSNIVIHCRMRNKRVTHHTQLICGSKAMSMIDKARPVHLSWNRYIWSMGPGTSTVPGTDTNIVIKIEISVLWDNMIRSMYSEQSYWIKILRMLIHCCLLSWFPKFIIFFTYLVYYSTHYSIICYHKYSNLSLRTKPHVLHYFSL